MSLRAAFPVKNTGQVCAEGPCSLPGKAVSLYYGGQNRSDSRKEKRYVSILPWNRSASQKNLCSANGQHRAGDRCFSGSAASQ